MNLTVKRFSTSSMVIMTLAERETFEFLSVAFWLLQASNNAAWTEGDFYLPERVRKCFL
jgi:hypothetical protein